MRISVGGRNYDAQQTELTAYMLGNEQAMLRERPHPYLTLGN